MKVLVVASPGQQEEWFAIPHDTALELTVVTSFDDDIPGITYDACIDLLFDDTTERANSLRKLSSLNIINSVEQILDPQHPDFIRMNGWNSFLKRPLVEAAVLQDELRGPAMQLFQQFGRNTRWVNDITGFITPRIIVSIINEAFFSLEEKVSTEDQIDIAMKTGTNYPYGPFEWSRKIGLEKVYSLLLALSKEHDRYQPSTLLKTTVLA
jgi:3-hydroxybutyryl-CoA dehydrogenase